MSGLARSGPGPGPQVGMTDGKAPSSLTRPDVVEAMGRAVDAVRGLSGSGIVIREANPAGRVSTRRLRLPRLPGDLNVVIRFGSPALVPTSPIDRTALRNELLLGGLTCGSAVFGWIGFVGSAFLAAPTGGLLIPGMIYDGLAAGAASISCINSGVRILNEARGSHRKNDMLDRNAAYTDLLDGLDSFGLAGLARGGADGARGLQAIGRAVATTPYATSAVLRVVGTMTIDKEMKTRLVNGLSAAMGLIATNDAGILGKTEKTAGISFTVVLSN